MVRSENFDSCFVVVVIYYIKYEANILYTLPLVSGFFSDGD